MKVPYNYLPYEFQNPNLIFNKWRKLIKSTQFTLGPYIEKFEKQFLNILVLNIVFQQIMGLMH